MAARIRNKLQARLFSSPLTFHIYAILNIRQCCFFKRIHNTTEVHYDCTTSTRLFLEDNINLHGRMYIHCLIASGSCLRNCFLFQLPNRLSKKEVVFSCAIKFCRTSENISLVCFKEGKKNQKHTTTWIRTWSPTALLTDRSEAYPTRSDGIVSSLQSVVVCTIDLPILILTHLILFCEDYMVNFTTIGKAQITSS